MSLTFIETSKLPKISTGQGEMTEILNNALCGAKNIVGSLRWLKAADAFTPEKADKHQLIYLMEGKGTISLDNKDYSVEKGAGIYLGPQETAMIKAAQGDALKLFHIVVPNFPKK